MEIEQNPTRQAAIQKAVSIMEWEGAPISGGLNPTISPNQELVSDQRQDPTHPLVRGRTKSETLQ